MKQLLAPFVLRRRKCKVLWQLMPLKASSQTRRVEFAPFDDATQNVYNSSLSSHLVARQSGPSSAGSTANDDKESAEAQQSLFISLHKAGNHLLLVRTQHTSKEPVEHLTRTLTSKQPPTGSATTQVPAALFEAQDVASQHNNAPSYLARAPVQSPPSDSAVATAR